ncbi:MAG: riboflavin kinase, partial [Actinomycetales bacterium]
RGLIDQARRLADDRGLVLIALTFDPHPASVIPGRQAPAALASLDERIALLEAAGADEVVVLAFDRALAAMEPAEFVDRVLVDRLQGTVVHGDHRGRELGYPTANLAWAGDPAIPQDGVYAGWLLVDQGRRTLPAAISVGTNPQFDGQQRRVEAHVIGQDGLDLYGQLVAVDFQEHLRPQLRFDSVAELVTQMGQDVERSRVRLARGAG